MADPDAWLHWTILRRRRGDARERNDLDCIAGHASFPDGLRAAAWPAAREGAPRLCRGLRLLRHERPRGCRDRSRVAVAGSRPAGTRAMDARGRAWLGPPGAASDARAARRARCQR